MSEDQNDHEDEGVQKQRSKLKMYAEVISCLNLLIIQCYLIAGALPALIFPIAGLVTSFLQLTSADDYLTCRNAQIYGDDPNYDDHLRHVMRSYSCWYFGYSVMYFIIVYRPFKFLYKVSGLLMLFTMLVGYAICFMNIAFLSEAHCATETTYGRMGQANTIIFLVVATFVMVTTHVIIWLSFCAGCIKQGCCRGNDQVLAEDQQQEPEQNQDESTKKLNNNEDEDQMSDQTKSGGNNGGNAADERQEKKDLLKGGDPDMY
eukprot:403362341